MENQAEAALVLPVGNENTQADSEVRSEIRTVKCKPGQGKLNRTIVKAQAQITAMGHKGKRFKRDYVTGTATYTCPDCGAIAVVTVDKTMGGAALTQQCTGVPQNSEVQNG